MVELVWITPEAEYLIAYQARVSNPKNQKSREYENLIRYCATHGHWSIFEMANMCLQIRTTRDIANQIVRHRSFSFQQFSLRYAEPTNLIIPDIRLQNEKNRQSSVPLPENEETMRLREWWERRVSALYSEIKALYQEGLGKGIAKENLRGILPLSTETMLYMNGTIRSWIHYIQVRTQEDTQLEHRQVALACKEIFCKHLPTVAKAVFP